MASWGPPWFYRVVLSRRFLRGRVRPGSICTTKRGDIKSATGYGVMVKIDDRKARIQAPGRPSAVCRAAPARSTLPAGSGEGATAVTGRHQNQSLLFSPYSLTFSSLTVEQLLLPPLLSGSSNDLCLRLHSDTEHTKKKKIRRGGHVLKNKNEPPHLRCVR